MRESSLVFRPYLVCPLYLLALLTFATKFVGEPDGNKDRGSSRRPAGFTTEPDGREDFAASQKKLPGNLKN